MRAIVYRRFGGPEVLEAAEIATPRPAPGEALVKVHAAGLNPIDWKIRRGDMQAYFPYEFPIVPGWDIAGTVTEADAESRWPVGTSVFAYARGDKVHHGGYAEYIPVAADALAAMPDSLDFAQAAAVPIVGLTAWQALAEGAVAAGHTILVHAGAGGVGSLAIPLAKERGAVVIATASPANHGYVETLGADHAVDYRDPAWPERVHAIAPGGLDFVLDSVGAAVHEPSAALMKPGAVMVSLNEPPDDDDAKAIKAVRLFAMPDGAALARLAARFADGRLPIPEITTAPLKDAAAMQRRSEAGHVRGKIVLRVVG